MTHSVLLYYLYTPLKNPQEVAVEQRLLCEKLDLKGRIIIAEEGINGTVEGLRENGEEYMRLMKASPLFKSIKFKVSEGTGNAFPKLSIKVRSEIVSAHLGDQDVNPVKTTGKYLEAEELHAWIHSDKEFYIVDMRNDYEHVVGHFEGSLLPPLKNFRDLPEIMPQLEHLRGKTVVTVCTGGVRCEKASGFLVEQGFADVYQLKDGIVSYMEKYPNQDFNGQLYVFDGRVTMGFNLDDPNRKIIGRCERCGVPSERYINCADMSCHRHFICCENCGENEMVTCGLEHHVKQLNVAMTTA